MNPGKTAIVPLTRSAQAVGQEKEIINIELTLGSKLHLGRY